MRGRKAVKKEKVVKSPFKICIGRREGKKYQFDKLDVADVDALLKYAARAVSESKKRNIHEVLLVIR